VPAATRNGPTTSWVRGPIRCASRADRPESKQHQHGDRRPARPARVGEIGSET